MISLLADSCAMVILKVNSLYFLPSRKLIQILGRPTDYVLHGGGAEAGEEHLRLVGYAHAAPTLRFWKPKA